MIVSDTRVSIIFGCLIGGIRLLGKKGNIAFWILVVGMAVFITIFCITKIMEIFEW